MEQQILFFDKKSKKFRLETAEKSELVDNVILSNVIFFIAPLTQKIIREDRKPRMSDFDAKFPHAFALAMNREENMQLANNPALIWKDFDYDVFKDDFFCLDKTKESLKGHKIKYLMIKQEGNQIRRRVVLQE